MGSYDGQKLLIANRGEIAVRIIKTAKRIGLRTVAIYTPSDALSPHVALADEAAPLRLAPATTANTAAAEAQAYMNGAGILRICEAHDVTLLHPGYGFLSENADFAAEVVESGVGWVGPRPEIIRLMGVKHRARETAADAGVPVVPGSSRLLVDEERAVRAAEKYGFPVLLKATLGGGGMGMVVCEDEAAVRSNFAAIKGRAMTLFGSDGVFLERYIPAARHIEVQVFGNGLGDVVHMRERECSIQRRHQKVIEESPSPFCYAHPGIRERMCEIAMRLARIINYDSAGTVEFILDERTEKFYFLEMNTRIQVEHAITEVTHGGLDLIELMIKQAIAQGTPDRGLHPNSPEMQQRTYHDLFIKSVREGISSAIEGRIYSENPYEGFVPSTGLLQHVSFGKEQKWLRVDTWVDTGMSITPSFDPLLAKVIVAGGSRREAISRFLTALETLKISGPPNNIEYLRDIGKNETFCAGLATTTFLSNFTVNARAFKVLSPGIDTTIQDLPGRTIRFGMPRSGPMDDVAFSTGNILVGNDKNTEGLEIVVVPGVGFALQFFVQAVVAVTGKDTIVKVDGVEAPLWSRIIVPANGKLEIQAKPMADAVTGFRTYLCIRGGFPNIPLYLGSKSTSMGLGGYQGRSLIKGDFIFLGDCSAKDKEKETDIVLPKSILPKYPSHWIVHVLSGPHDDEEFITREGIDRFYSTKWRISPSSNRLGIRLEAPTSADKIRWARESGGEGGSHPSNILDNGYAPGTININGDTPVIITNEGPDMGGYLCMCTVATSEMWKLGQLAPGSTVEFCRIGWQESLQSSASFKAWLASVAEFVASSTSPSESTSSELRLFNTSNLQDAHYSPILHTRSAPDSGSELTVTFRQAGDSAILVEFGQMRLDIFIRARIHAFQTILRGRNDPGIGELCPCIRSILCHYDPHLISQDVFLRILVESEDTIPQDMTTMKFPGRRITFPIVLDDHWNKDALARYISTTRDKAVYLPSNIDYLAKNNGLANAAEALQKLIESDWLVLGVGFYLACPFLVPIDPRCRLIGQKMNPSRTFTPRGAIGIAGPVAAIYPIESPGGYQLFGRTLPGWQTWGKGKDFEPSKPWLLEAFDQVHFTPVTESEYVKLEKQFDAGRYSFEIESVIFSVEEHSRFLDSIADEIEVYRQKQEISSTKEAERERILLQEWEDERSASASLTQATESLSLDDEDGKPDLTELTSSLFATIWKINFKPGDVIPSDDAVVVVLEAMKTEIPILAGEGNSGKKVARLGRGIKEGASVVAGEVLVVLA